MLDNAISSLGGVELCIPFLSFQYIQYSKNEVHESHPITLSSTFVNSFSHSLHDQPTLCILSGGRYFCTCPSSSSCLSDSFILRHIWLSFWCFCCIFLKPIVWHSRHLLYYRSHQQLIIVCVYRMGCWVTAIVFPLVGKASQFRIEIFTT